MRFRRMLVDDRPECHLWNGGGWRNLSGSKVARQLVKECAAASNPPDLLSFLQLPPDELESLLVTDMPEGRNGLPLLPIVPRSFRDFMLYENHAIGAARGMAKRLMPAVYGISRIYEGLTRRPFPAFRPNALFYRQPVYYLSGHLNMMSNDAEMPWPQYGNLLDYELEIGAFLARPLRNASPEAVATALAGFVVLNDFSVRDVQIPEMRSGFGPQKSKHFASSISCEIVTPDEILPRLDALSGSVMINGTCVATVSSGSPQFSLLQAIAHASCCETLYPGELFGSGTLPGGAGIENGALVSPGDILTLRVEGLASLTNLVGKPGGEKCVL